MGMCELFTSPFFKGELFFGIIGVKSDGDVVFLSPSPCLIKAYLTSLPCLQTESEGKKRVLFTR